MSFLNCVKQKQPSDVPETANSSSCFAFLPRPQLAERALSCKNVKKNFCAETTDFLYFFKKNYKIQPRLQHPPPRLPRKKARKNTPTTTTSSTTTATNLIVLSSIPFISRKMCEYAKKRAPWSWKIKPGQTPKVTLKDFCRMLQDNCQRWTGNRQMKDDFFWSIIKLACIKFGVERGGGGGGVGGKRFGNFASIQI